MRLRVELTRAPEAPAAARRALGQLAEHVPLRRLEDARLLVSELVTNSVRHAGLTNLDIITLVLVADDRTIRIEVRDPGTGFEPGDPVPDPARPSGWGLYLVRALSDRWGVESGDETLVWFELDADAAD